MNVRKTAPIPIGIGSSWPEGLLRSIKRRPVARGNDEETLTFDADSRVERSEWFQDEGDRWKAWDRDEGWHGHNHRYHEDWNYGWDDQSRDDHGPGRDWERGQPNDGHDGWDDQLRDNHGTWRDWERGQRNDGHDGWDDQPRDDPGTWRDWEGGGHGNGQYEFQHVMPREPG